MQLANRDIAKGHKYRISGMVVGVIKIKELLVLKFRNMFWITTTVVVIGNRREQVFL